MNRIWVIQKRKLAIKEITVTKDTFIKVIDVGDSIFFDKWYAQIRLNELIEKRSKR